MKDIRRGNCSTNQSAEILRSHLVDIQAFENNPNLGILTLYYAGKPHP